MEDMMTVRQAATALEISTTRVYTLLASGALSGKKIGLTRMVNRRSVAIYKESPSRNKFAGGHLRRVGEEQGVLPLDRADDPVLPELEEWSGLRPPTLSIEARREYDASPLGQREARITAQAARGEL